MKIIYISRRNRETEECNMNKMAGKIVYVSGPYRAKTIMGKLLNIWRARQVAIRIWRLGGICICPHMNTALFKEDGMPYIAGDCEIVKRCDIIYMMRGWESSEGAKIELATAKNYFLEVIYAEG